MQYEKYHSCWRNGNTPVSAYNINTFLGLTNTPMVLGYNVFYDGGFTGLYVDARRNAENGMATFFDYYAEDSERFGVMELDEECNILSV